MTILQGIAILDGLLTVASRIESWLASRRQVGEMTPEEEVAHDALLEKMFAKWQQPLNGKTTAIEARD